MAFHASTQRSHWLFATQAEIDAARVRANTAARDEIFRIYASAPDLKQPDIEDFLTPEEERLLCQFYESKLQDVCSLFPNEFPPTVMAIAMTYFRRFYMNNSVMDHHPKDIMLACVYLATKIDDLSLSIDDFVRRVVPGADDDAKVSKNRTAMIESIRDLEVHVMRENKFHLTIHAPYRAVRGFVLDIKRRHNDAALDLGDIERSAKDVVDRLYLTDAVLLHPPSVLALAAIAHAAKTLGGNLDGYVRTLAGAATPEALANFDRRFDDVQEHIDRDTTVDERGARDVDRKLRGYKRNQATKEAADEDARLREVEAARKRSEDRERQDMAEFESLGDRPPAKRPRVDDGGAR